MTSFNHNYLLRTLSPNTVILRVRTSTYEFVGDTIHSIAWSKLSRRRRIIQMRNNYDLKRLRV